MSRETKYKLSRERLEELQEQLNYLQTVREREVAQQIKEARAFGDLSENSEYDEAKTEQGKLYSRIAEIKNLIDNAEIIEYSENTDIVSMGSKVTIMDMETKSEETYQIVGSQEADPMRGRISDDSPFGKALLDRKEGDKITVEAPAGTLKYKIVRLEN